MTRASLASLSTGLRCLLCVALLAPCAAFAEDPEAVYRRFHAAMVAGDLDAMMRDMPAARHREMAQMPEKDRKTVANMFMAIMPKAITITETTVAADGASAALEARGEGDSLGGGTEEMTGRIHMIIEHGAWKIDTSNWKSPEKTK